jgi:hypothetical protein
MFFYAHWKGVEFLSHLGQSVDRLGWPKLARSLPPEQFLSAITVPPFLNQHPPDVFRQPQPQPDSGFWARLLQVRCHRHSLQSSE